MSISTASGGKRGQPWRDRQADDDHPTDLRQASRNALPQRLAHQTDDLVEPAVAHQGIAIGAVEEAGVDEDQAPANEPRGEHRQDGSRIQAVVAPERIQQHRAQKRRERQERGGLAHPRGMDAGERDGPHQMVGTDVLQQCQDAQQQPADVERVVVRLGRGDPERNRERQRERRGDAAQQDAATGDPHGHMMLVRRQPPHLLEIDDQGQQA
jgi:hypothetical protein